jgi:hypothetical protein
LVVELRVIGSCGDGEVNGFNTKARRFEDDTKLSR